MVGNAGLTNSELISETLLRRANLKDYYETSAAPHIIGHEILLRRENLKDYYETSAALHFIGILVTE